MKKQLKGKTASQVDPVTKKAQSLLNQWADWLKSTPGFGGYSISSYTERLDDGFIEVLPDNETAQKVEAVLCKIKKHWPRVFMAIYYKYYLGDTLEQVADKLKASVGSVRGWLRVGEACVVTGMDDESENETYPSLKKSA